MNHDEAAQLLGVFALHALEADEHLGVIAHLATCAWCQAEASRYEQLLSFLGDIGEPDDAA